MATVMTPPIDWYTESIEDADQTPEPPHGLRRFPQENGDCDGSAQDTSERKLDEVLGW